MKCPKCKSKSIVVMMTGKYCKSCFWTFDKIDNKKKLVKIPVVINKQNKEKRPMAQKKAPLTKEEKKVLVVEIKSAKKKQVEAERAAKKLIAEATKQGKLVQVLTAKLAL